VPGVTHRHHRSDHRQPPVQLAISTPTPGERTSSQFNST
jgi:hypothetical protein